MRADFSYALRTLRKNPGFTFVAILSLALGIGANTAIFSLMNQILLRLLPVERPREVVQLDHTGPNRGSTWNDKSWSYFMYRDLRDKATSLAGLVGHFPTSFSFSEGGQTERVRGDIVSGNYFQVLGVQPTIGRLLTPEDDKKLGAHPVAVITHGFWVQRFGGNPDVLNKKVLINGQPFTIIGVAERGFNGLDLGRYTDVMAPITMKKQLTPTWNGLDDRRTLWLQVYGRLKPGVTREQAQAELQAIYHPIIEMELQQMDKVSERFRKAFLDKKLVLLDGSHGNADSRASMSKPLIVLMCMVGMVLLIACANLANLLMARSTGRRKEIAIRLAMGASRGQVIRQLLVESILLGVLGGVAGLIVASWTVDFLMLTMNNDAQLLARGPHYFDWRVMSFNIVLSVLTGLIFGLIPALQSTKSDVAPALKDEAGSISMTGVHVRFRKALIASQVALSLLLLIAAGLFAKSLYNLKSLNPGFRADSLVQFEVDTSLNAYDNARTIDFYRRLQENLERTPGVQGVGMSANAVMDNDISRSTVAVQGYESKEGEDVQPLVNTVGPHFFRTFGIPLVSGRDFTERDILGAPKAAIINESFAKYFYKGENPLGRRFRFGGRGETFDIEIVGVVKDSKHGSLREKAWRAVFIPYSQNEHMGGFVYYVRAAMDPAAIGATIRREVSRIDANMPVARIQTLENQIDRSITAERLASMLSLAFGGLATLLAAVGLYGVMAFIVARRTREIGIRMALGALQGSVVWLVMKEVAWMTGVGLAIGLPAAIAAGRFIESQLFGIQPRDVAVLCGSILALMIVAALAGYVPAKRATSIDPIQALRYE